MEAKKRALGHPGPGPVIVVRLSKAMEPKMKLPYSGRTLRESNTNVPVPVTGSHFCESCREYFPSVAAIKFHNSRVHQPRRIASNMYHCYEDDARKERFVSPELDQLDSPREETPGVPSRITLYPPSNPENNSSKALLPCEDCPFSLFTTDSAYQSHRQYYHGGADS